MNRPLGIWLAIGIIAYLGIPWYAIEDGFWDPYWMSADYMSDGDAAPALFQALWHGTFWLAPIGLFLFAPLLVLTRRKSDPIYGRVLIWSGGLGFAYLLFQGFAIGLRGWEYAFLESLFGPLEDRQYGMGYGALLIAGAYLFTFTQGIAARGAIKGDIFVVSAIGLVIALVTTFVLFPVSRILLSALKDDEFNYNLPLFAEKFFDDRIWGLNCLTSSLPCGIAWHSLTLSVMVGLGTTALGLAFALIVTRTNFKAKRALRAISVLPIITPPFVIGLAIILLFGQSGAVTQFVAGLLDIPAGRWVYGFNGIFFAQMLAFTPIAFLVLIGVVEGVSPSMEEASQTLGADSWKTFTTVSLPLMRPGLANAFLLGFIESMADFGNPFILGANYDVLSTEIFFAIVGAQGDQSRAAVLAIVLLFFTLSAFFVQRKWLGKKSYTTVTGKGDSGLHSPLPKRLNWLVLGTAMPWLALTIVIYLMILFGGFVETWGRDHSFTLKHYVDAFAIVPGEHGWIWAGGAWNSFFTTLTIAAIAAPLTAGLGLLIAYLLVRQHFAGKEFFEFGTMLSFAIPGTVIGISYVLAFNVPPFELTGSGAILVLCFIFRNLPVGVRAGIASMSQLDSSLDEASLTLGANSWTTLKKVVLPLLRPAIVAALVYSFVRAITAISAVIFLVSANYDMATSYIIGRVENGDYGVSIAYSSVLILVMLIATSLVQFTVGKSKITKRHAGQDTKNEEAPA